MIMERIDTRPTQTEAGFKIRRGRPFPYGASLYPVVSTFQYSLVAAIAVRSFSFKRRETKPFAEIPFPEAFRTGNIFTMTVFELDS